ncbi:MAG: hypothetical protein C3F02_04375 [Parcubacteria group bacterium]|nr:MAG: hypothetical protein C3F02_04375 [Parcubacteria group bacterium]
MKSIERRFAKIRGRNPYWSSYVCFFSAIEGQNFSKQAIARWFNKLVEKGCFSPKDKKGILAHLYTPARPPEDNQK